MSSDILIEAAALRLLEESLAVPRAERQPFIAGAPYPWKVRRSGLRLLDFLDETDDLPSC